MHDMKRILSTFVLALMALGAMGQEAPQRDSTIARARYLKSIYKTDHAIDLLSTLVTGTMDEEVLSELADCHVQNGDYGTAAGTYSMLSQLRPQNIPYKVKLMQLNSRMKDYLQAAELGKQILQTDSIPAISLLVGDSYLNAKLADSAYVYYSMAYRMAHSSRNAVSKLSRVLLDRKQYDDVIAVTGKYLAGNPDDMEIGPVCGLAHFLKSDYDSCLRVMQHQEDIGNDSYGVHLYLGQASWQINDVLAASDELKRAWQIDSSDVNLACTIGAVETALGNDPAPWLGKAMDMMTPDPKVVSGIHRQQAEYYMRAGKYAEAAGAYRKAYDCYPEGYSVLSNIGYCYEKMKDYEKAREWYERYLSVGRPDSSGYRFVKESLEYVRQQLFMEGKL